MKLFGNKTSIKVKRKKKDQHKDETEPLVQKNRILAIILKKNSGVKWIWLKPDIKGFGLDGNYYYIDRDGIYISDNHVACSIYIEGVSLPIGHDNLEKETKTVKYTESITGEEKKRKITKIKGLKFDSELLNMLVNEDLAEDFIKTKLDMPNFVLIILVLAGVVIGVINIGMWFL